MAELHSLLRRQLRRIYGSEDAVPDAVQQLVPAVNDAYREFDADREMIERSLDLSSTELLQANSDLGAVLEAFLDLFFHIDHDGAILAYRVGTRSDLYLAPDEFIGRRIQDIPLGNVADRFEEAIARVHATNELVNVKYSLKLNGNEQFYEARLLPLHNKEIAVIIRNITEPHQARERERALQEQLARSQRMESLGVLAGGIAHDLNNIMGPLVAYPAMLMEDLQPADEPREMIEEIETSARRAAAVIQDLLAMARRGNAISMPTDVNDLIRGYVKSGSFKELCGHHPACSLQLQLDETIPPAAAAQHHLTQAIMNLVSNACEATEGSGSVTISTEYANVAEHVGVYDTIQAGAYVIIRIHDTGQGISRDDIDHIFEPFYSRKKMGRSGSGLGLTVVYGVIRDMDGYVDVKTAPGEGTDMRLYIPVSEERVEPAPDQPLTHEGSERILIVDDVAEQRLLAGKLLESMGYHVESATDGPDAIRWCENNQADLILMDMILESDLDGLDTYRKILALSPGQKCVIASGYSETERVREALAIGAGGFIAKPYTREQLGQAVREELDRDTAS